MCKLKEAEILEPLIPTIKNNLEHRHAFVRRNAVLAVYSIFKSFDYLLPDGPELVEAVLQQEQDASCKRNAFLMLFHSSQERAVEYLSQNLEQVSNWSDILQLVVLELIRKIVRANPFEKSRYIRCILTLFSSESNAVVYECASVLVALSSSATAIRAAANSYTQLLSSQSDNNIKLIVLERLQDLKRQHSKVLQEMVMDIIRALSSANLDIRRKTLEIMLDLIVPKNIAEIMQVLKKEVQKTQGEEGEKNAEYRAMLINAIHKSAIRFPESASMVVPVLMDFLGDSNQGTAVEVILFVREILETFPHLRESVMQKLLQTFPSIHSSRVARVALWLIGEFCVSGEEVAAGFTTLKASLGELPFALAAGAQETVTPNGSGAGGGRAEGRPVVLADGTYASVIAADDARDAADASPKLRSLIVGGDFFLATVVATTMTKLALRSRAHLPAQAANMVAADVMLILTGMLQLGKAGTVGQTIDADSQERLTTYLHLLSNPGEDVQQLCLIHCHEAFSSMLSERASQEEGEKPSEEAVPEVNRQADDLISVRQLKGGKPETAALEFDDDDDIVASATGAFKGELDFAARLKRVTQLTGLSDPVYAEAYVLVHSYDIMLDVLVINQTQEPMVNLCLELATVGDLKLCERPTAYTLAPGESKHIKANIKVCTPPGIPTLRLNRVLWSKTPTPRPNRLEAWRCTDPPPRLAHTWLRVSLQMTSWYTDYRHLISLHVQVSSTETGIVFGSIVYDAQGMPPPPGGGENRNCVVLNDLHIDIMDYIAPASCTDLAFRAMWAEFEWENKVAVNTDITEVKEFLEHVIKSTNMRCLTPPAALEGDSGFLAANLYAKSIFGEDALVNVSIEKRSDGKICGYIRIRSKTQGIALSLGDKITLKQKGPSA